MSRFYTAGDEPADILSLFPNEIESLVLSLGEKKYRAGQIFTRLYKDAESFFDMPELPLAFKQKISSSAVIRRARTVKKLVSELDGTVKFLFELDDGERIESVFMRYKHGNTLCISTQAGCRMGCEFCASTLNGLKRNLLPSEMIAQITAARRETGERISNVVLMGIGEPLDNYDNVLRFLRLINLPEGLNIGMRHVSLSTCGVCDKIDALAEENLQLTLSVSLHASDDATRCMIMPVARKWTLDRLIDSCRRYAEKTGRRISFEYAMIADVNDTEEDAHRLGRLLSGMLCHLNLIPVNPVEGKSFKKSDKNALRVFTQTVETYKISVTVRRRLGGDIDASCGQLRAGNGCL